MLEAYKKFWKNSFDYKEKSSRKDYWYVVLINSFIGFILGVSLGLTTVMASESVVLSVTLGVLAYCILVLPPSISLSVRRLRDGGFHWAFIFLYLIPTIGSIVLLVLYCMPTKQVSENEA
ncbi:DUF805 domain-containing protein [Enterococcus faecalis]|uniref:DUF805 domain-containing protein n=1 Tax=Enterococcus faecalis TaxID=1351 RepID=UPI00177D0731|nr:DUF805 domain-containing protein [Enterococcus faecalis]MBD9842463.1 DUF805 domain-containing protein [Enterococcus faecalis]